MYMKELKAKIEYNDILNSGMFLECYPNLTGNWELDKDFWAVEYKQICKRRKGNKIW